MPVRHIYCEVCKRYVDARGWHRHLVSIVHKANMGGKPTPPKATGRTYTPTYCSCGKVFPISPGKHFSANRNRWHRQIDKPVGVNAKPIIPNLAAFQPPQVVAQEQVSSEALVAVDRLISNAEDQIKVLTERVNSLKAAKELLLKVK